MYRNNFIIRLEIDYNPISRLNYFKYFQRVPNIYLILSLQHLSSLCNSIFPGNGRKRCIILQVDLSSTTTTTFSFFFSFRFLTRWKLIAFFKGDRERENLVFRGGRRGTFSEVSACLNLHSTRSMSPFRRRNSLPDQIRTATLEIQISIKRNITSKDLIIDI